MQQIFISLNPGSTSLKCEIFFEQKSIKSFTFNFEAKNSDYSKYFSQIINYLDTQSDLEKIFAVRIVHGGEKFREPTELNDEVIEEINKLSHLAPLHNPVAIECIRELKKNFRTEKIFGVFDSGFYANLPQKAYLYALPYEMYSTHAVRRYGFHGISHEYLIEEILKISPESSRIITCHLGGGASITASLNGVAVDTSMGFTPLEGLVMQTRSGDIDAGIILFLSDHLKLSIEEINKILNKKSGLAGLSQSAGDMKTLLEQFAVGEPNAIRAIESYVYRIQKYIGSYVAVLGGLDAFVISGSVGNGSNLIRQLICQDLRCFDIQIDDEKNNSQEMKNQIREISSGRTKVYTVESDEELMMVKKVQKLLG